MSPAMPVAEAPAQLTTTSARMIPWVVRTASIRLALDAESGRFDSALDRGTNRFGCLREPWIRAMLVQVAVTGAKVLRRIDIETGEYRRPPRHAPPLRRTRAWIL